MTANIRNLKKSKQIIRQKFKKSKEINRLFFEKSKQIIYF